MNNFISALLKIKYLPQVTILNTFKLTFWIIIKSNHWICFTKYQKHFSIADLFLIDGFPKLIISDTCVVITRVTKNHHNILGRPTAYPSEEPSRADTSSVKGRYKNRISENLFKNQGGHLFAFVGTFCAFSVTDATFHPYLLLSLLPLFQHHSTLCSICLH